MIPVPDHFERLGLPRRFAVDRDLLEREYLRRSREVHPDVHQLGSTSDQLASLELASALNDAYRVLKDPHQRAEYLLTLEGGPSASEFKSMPPAFLEEVLELRMAIEEMKQTAQPETPPFQEMEAQIDAKRAGLLEVLAGLFAQLEAVLPAQTRDSVLQRIRMELNSLKYIQGLKRDLHAEPSAGA